MVKVVKYPDPVLLQEATAATLEEAAQIVQLLEEVCKAQTWGKVVGMAAPQIGISKRVFLALDKAYINPWIAIYSKMRTLHKEGCYSLEEDKFDYPISRANEITMKWQDLKGKTHVQTFRGFEAQVIQHEYDHLQGKLCSGNN